MKKILLTLLMTIIPVLYGCSSYKMASVEDSQKSIDINRWKNDSLEAILKPMLKIPEGNDLIMKMELGAINKILNKYAYNRPDDILLFFRKSKDFMKEDKSTLGIKYTNFIDIDTGFVSLNLKSLQMNKLHQNKVDGMIELEGKGFISVSGKYTGIPASASPEVELYLNEAISMELLPTDTGYVVLKPVPKDIILKIKFSINLLGWKIPYYQEIPLKFAEMMKPVGFPLAVNADVTFPLPAQKFGNGNIEMVPYQMIFKKTKVTGVNTKIEYRTDIDLKRK
jgi:hypothetical protein